jgi:hypothetical protein
MIQFPEETEQDKMYKHFSLMLALHCVRNTVIEDYHAAGKLTDPEMMAFNKEVANKLYSVIQIFWNPEYAEIRDLVIKDRDGLYVPPNWDEPVFDKDLKTYIEVLAAEKENPKE